MKTMIGTVAYHREIVPGIFDMGIDCGEAANAAQAGQFVNILCEGGDALLRRPISVCDAEGNLLRIVYEVKGKGTTLLSKYQVGQSVNFLGPLGHGFDTASAGEKPLVIGGGIGTYPLLLLTKKLNNANVFLGFRDKNRLTLLDEFERIANTKAATDDGSFGYHGLVTDLVKTHLEQHGGSMIYACGPKPMLKAVQALAAQYGVPSRLSMEERMGCGIGACLVCACKTKAADGQVHQSHVCCDGPVFDGKTIVFD